jgi:hypothetical protein
MPNEHAVVDWQSPVTASVDGDEFNGRLGFSFDESAGLGSSRIVADTISVFMQFRIQLPVSE